MRPIGLRGVFSRLSEGASFSGSPGTTGWAIMREPHSGRHDLQPVESGPKQAPKISTVKGQEHIRRGQSAEENRSILLDRKHDGFIERQHIVHQHQLGAEPKLHRGSLHWKRAKVPRYLADGIWCRQ